MISLGAQRKQQTAPPNKPSICRRSQLWGYEEIFRFGRLDELPSWSRRRLIAPSFKRLIEELEHRLAPLVVVDVEQLFGIASSGPNIIAEGLLICAAQRISLGLFSAPATDSFL